MNYLKYIILLLTLFVTNSFAQWNDNAWPASNHTYFVGTTITGNISLQTNSTSVTLTSTNWNFLYKDFPVKYVQLMCPTEGVYYALVEQTNVWVKTALPNLPNNTLSATSNNNTCVTNSITNKCASVTSTYTNYYYIGPNSTNTTTNITFNSVGCVICTNIVIKVIVDIDPCSSDILIVVTNKVVSTNSYYSMSSITNQFFGIGSPTNTLYSSMVRTNGVIPPFTWIPNPNAINCSSTNIPQLVGIGYTKLVNTNNMKVYYQQDWVTPGYGVWLVTNNLSYFYPNTNSSLNVADMWTYDSALAVGERQLANNSLTNEPIEYQRFGEDNHATVNLNINQWKDWIIYYAPWFNVSPLADTNGSFKTYCETPRTNWVWKPYEGMLFYDGEKYFTNVNTWVASTNYYRPPTYYENMYYPASGVGVQRIPAYGFQPMMSLKDELCELLKLPQQKVRYVITNTGEFFGYQDDWGKSTLHSDTTGLYLSAYTSHDKLVETQWVAIASCNYFNYTPDLHFQAPATGYGHTITNNWTLKNQWLNLLTYTYTISFDGTNGFNVNQIPSSNIDVTNTLQIVTNTLSIAGNTYYLAKVTSTSGDKFDQSSNAVIKVRNIDSISTTNKTTTNSKTISWAETQTNTLSCSITNNICIASTNTFTFSDSVVITNEYDVTGSNTASTSFTIPNIVTNIITCCGTNNITNLVVFTPYTQYVGSVSYDFTNVASVALNVIENDYFGFDTNINFVANSNVLLSIIYTNSINATNITGVVFTNWNVAEGYTERDYEFDGVKTCINSLNKFPVSLQWITNNATLTSRYGTISAVSLVDTGSFGSFSNAIWVTGACYTNNTGPVFYKEQVQLPPAGQVVESRGTEQVGDLDRRGYMLVDSILCYGQWGFIGTGTVVTKSCLVFDEFGMGTNVYTYYGPFTTGGAYKDFFINTFLANTDPECVFSGDFFGSTNYSEAKTYWHGEVPNEDARECDGSLYGLVKFSQITSYSNQGCGYIDYYGGTYNGKPADREKCATHNFTIQEQSSAGVFSDIYKNYNSAREVYVPGNLNYIVGSSGDYLLWKNTSILPVPVEIVAGSTTYASDDNYCNTEDIIDSGYLMDNHTYYNRLTGAPIDPTIDAAFYTSYTNDPDGFTTNIMWTTTPMWAGTWNGWDDTNSVPIWGLMLSETAKTNSLVVTNLLSKKMLISTNSLQGGSVKIYNTSNDAIIIINYSITNGFPHK